jgi:hypothetical protein
MDVPDPAIAVLADIEREAERTNTLKGEESDLAYQQYLIAWKRLTETRPTTPQGAAAIVAFVRADLSWGHADHHDEALRRVEEALTEMHIIA